MPTLSFWARSIGNFWNRWAKAQCRWVGQSHSQTAVRRVREHSLRNPVVAEAKGEREGEEGPCHPQQDDSTLKDQTESQTRRME